MLFKVVVADVGIDFGRIAGIEPDDLVEQRVVPRNDLGCLGLIHLGHQEALDIARYRANVAIKHEEALRRTPHPISSRPSHGYRVDADGTTSRTHAIKSVDIRKADIGRGVCINRGED